MSTIFRASMFGSALLMVAPNAFGQSTEWTKPSESIPAGRDTSILRQSVFEDSMIDPYRPRTLTPWGMSATVGGGVQGFTGKQARNFTDTGVGWNARFVFGTRSIVGAELAYVGSSQDIYTLGLDKSAFLQSHGGELAARLNFLPGMVQPFVFAGAGVTRYLLSNEDVNTSSIDSRDTVVDFPLGVGTDLRYEGFLVDARGTFRPTVGDNLFDGSGQMHTWGANLAIGSEF